MPLMPMLHRAALRFTHCPDLAADLVQESLLRAYRGFDGFQPGTHFKAWLFKILYSTFVNSYHKVRREAMVTSLEGLEERFEKTLEVPDWDAYREVLRSAEPTWSAAVVRAVEALPEPYRVAVLLVDVEELSYEEAASVAGCKLGTLRSRLFRARRALALDLAEHAREQGYPRESGT